MAKTPNTKTTPAAQPADVSFATSAAPPQQPQGEGGAEGVDSGATTAVAAPTENGTVPTIPPESDSTNSTGAVDQAGESQPQPPQGESGADIISSGVADQLAPAKAESLDLWVKNNGVFSKTEPRSKVLLGAGQVTQIKITSAVMRQTIKRNIEQMNHLAGGRLMVLVDQPVVEEGN